MCHTADLIGAVLILFTGLTRPITAAVWLSTVLLVRSFRGFDRWYATLPVLVATVVFSWLSITGDVSSQ
jgi:hypothetical protein